MANNDDQKTETGQGENIKADTVPRLICNQTAKRLRIEGDNNSLLVLAPLEKNREVEADEIKLFNHEGLQQRNIIRVQKKTAENSDWIVGVGVWAYIIYFIIGLTVIPKDEALSLPIIKSINARPLYFIIVAIVIGLALIVLKRSQRGNRVVQRIVAQGFSLLLIFTVGAGVPTFAVYWFGGGQDALKSPPSLAYLWPVLQLIFIVVASVLPALLYFLFDRQLLDTLRQRFEHQIFRLDPNMETLTDVRAKYGRQIDEIYGAERNSGVGRLGRGTRWPILVATLVITLGWMLTLPLADLRQITDNSAKLNLFLPDLTGVAFGFLGTYFFALSMILRRYTRGDLKPKAYSSITVRVFIVFILAWVLGVIFTADNPEAAKGVWHSSKLVFMFMVGIIPETGLTFIYEKLRNFRLFRKKSSSSKNSNHSLEERHPLTYLQGIDLYDRARLLDEGVTNIESLAHHDLVDLMLETRIPVARLVDWVDQAILYLHLMADDEDLEASHALRKRLREYGIRTVTDLEKAYQAAKERSEQAGGNDELERLLRTLGGQNNKKDAAAKDGQQAKTDPCRMQVILDTLRDDEWLEYIHCWRDNSRVKEQKIVARSGQDIVIHRAVVEKEYASKEIAQAAGV